MIKISSHILSEKDYNLSISFLVLAAKKKIYVTFLEKRQIKKNLSQPFVLRQRFYGTIGILEHGDSLEITFTIPLN